MSYIVREKLWNLFNQSHTAYIMSLVINALRGGHTHIPTHESKQFQETRLARLSATHTWFKNLLYNIPTFILLNALTLILFTKLSCTLLVLVYLTQVLFFIIKPGTCHACLVSWTCFGSRVGLCVCMCLPLRPLITSHVKHMLNNQIKQFYGFSICLYDTCHR